jgi:hypothetical protein
MVVVKMVVWVVVDDHCGSKMIELKSLFDLQKISIGQNIVVIFSISQNKW